MAKVLLPHQFHRKLGTVKKTPEHVARVKAAQKREKSKATDPARSSKWPAFRKKYLAEHKTNGGGCEACGAKTGLQLHHVHPFHTDPSLELDPSNMLVVCMFVGGLECHEKIAHSEKGFKWVNPNSRADCADLMAHPDKLEEIRARAVKNAIPNAPDE
jgi:hypothetical protein